MRGSGLSAELEREGGGVGLGVKVVTKRPTGWNDAGWGRVGGNDGED